MDNFGYSIQDIEKIISDGQSAVLQHKVSSEDLDMLISSARTQEQEFYKILPHLSNGEPVKSAEDMNILISEFDNQYNLKSLLPGGAVEEIMSKTYNLNESNNTAVITEEESNIIREVMQTLYQQGLEYTKSEILEIDDNRMAVILPQIRNYIFNMISIGIANNPNLSTSEKVNLTNTTDFSNSNKILLDSVSLEIDPNNLRASLSKKDFSFNSETKTRNNKRYTVVDSKSISVMMKPNGASMSPFGLFRKEFSMDLKEYLLDISESIINKSTERNTGEKKNPMSVSYETFKQDSIDAVKQCIGSIVQWEKYLNIISTNIGIGRSLSTLRGFTGEIRSYILFDLLMQGTGNSVHATGLQDKIKIFKDMTAEEAPADIFIKLLNSVYSDIGIQVKNTIRKSYSWSGSMIASNFYRERLQEIMLDKEINYYGAMTYNQPIGEATLNYKKIYNKFEDQQNFTSTFNSLAFRIIRQLTKVSEGPEIFSSEISNNFFMMNNRIIAGSDILMAIRENAYGKSTYVKSNFSIEKGSGTTWQPGDPYVIDYVANSIINYSITLAYDSLARTAYNAK